MRITPFTGRRYALVAVMPGDRGLSAPDAVRYRVELYRRDDIDIALAMTMRGHDVAQAIGDAWLRGDITIEVES